MMNEQVMGTVVDGAVELDSPLQLPNQTRVLVKVELVAPTTKATESGWEAMERLIRERPIHLGGVRYTRDELHERR
jgi:hypothetical protein